MNNRNKLQKDVGGNLLLQLLENRQTLRNINSCHDATLRSRCQPYGAVVRLDLPTKRGITIRLVRAPQVQETRSTLECKPPPPKCPCSGACTVVAKRIDWTATPARMR